MVDNKSSHDGFSSTWDAWTEQRCIFLSVPSLELRVLQKPLSSASLVPVDKVLMVHVIVDGADLSHQVVLVPYSGVISQGCGIVLDL
jgi:hypothetical protein